jgi:hypothetical protein
VVASIIPVGDGEIVVPVKVEVGKVDIAPDPFFLSAIDAKVGARRSMKVWSWIIL